MPGDKRSFEDRLPHVLAAEKLLAAGKREAAIVRAMGARFDLTPRQVRQDIAAARGRWGAKKAGGVGAALGMSVARRNHLYRLAVKAGDLRTALAVLESTDRLLGLYPKTRTVVVLRPKPAGAEGMTDAELERVARRGLGLGPAPATRPDPDLDLDPRPAARPEPEPEPEGGVASGVSSVPGTPRSAADPATHPAPPIAG